MEYLLAVDVQREFVKGSVGKRVYDRVIDFLHKMTPYYTVVAPVYQNKTNPNMNRLLGWNEMQGIMPLDFKPEYFYLHSGYSIKEYLNFQPRDTVDVIGFDTDACVLSACFDLFNAGVNFRILADGCWSSGGKELHQAALKIMERQFGKALDLNTTLEEVIYAHRTH